MIAVVDIFEASEELVVSTGGILVFLAFPKILYNGIFMVLIH